VDPLSDPNYCGVAANCTGGAACGPSTACYLGVCTPLCPSGQIVCSGVCVDPATNPNYCGATGYCRSGTEGTVCPSGICVGGVCQ
jgi:hypothetical protein